MRKTVRFFLVVLLSCGFAASARAAELPELAAARKARDQGDIGTLQRLIEQARSQAAAHNEGPSYEQLAQLDLWLCEGGHIHNDNKVLKQASQDGVAAAEKAIALRDNSSEAHRLLGDLLGELIPTVMMGGMRYGKRAADNFDRALALDPKNAEAFVGRSIGYIFTPSAFGGSKDKAIELLQKAIALDAHCDRAHIWLAQVYQRTGKHDDALREINAALGINPERQFAKQVYAQVTGKE